MTSPARPLPVRLDAVPGEALNSYTGRLAAANQLPAATVWPGRPPTRPTRPTGEDVDRIAALADLSTAGVAAMSVFSYPETVVGTSRLRRGGWMLYRPTWTCPVCTPATSVTMRDWALALHPVCTDCRCLLSTDPTQDPITAPAELVTLVENLRDRLHQSSRDRSSRDHLGDLLRHCALVAQTFTADWPLPRTEDEDALRSRGVQHGQWGRHPTPDPRTAAAVLLATAPAIADPRQRAWLNYDGWNRITDPEATGAPVNTGPRCPEEYLPAPLKTAELLRAVARRHDPGDQARGRRLVVELTRLAAEHRVFPHHVPALAYLPGEHPLPGRVHWSSRVGAALALHQLLALTMGDPEPALGHESAWPGHARLADALNSHGAIARDEADLLRGFLEALLAEGLVDYQRRRDILRAQSSVPAHVLRPLRLPGTDAPDVPGASAGRLASGWVWVHLTRGPMWASADPDLPTTTVLKFGRALDPEARLGLLDHGLQVLHEADTIPADLVAPRRPTIALPASSSA